MPFLSNHMWHLSEAPEAVHTSILHSSRTHSAAVTTAIDSEGMGNGMQTWHRAMPAALIWLTEQSQGTRTSDHNWHAERDYCPI